MTKTTVGHAEELRRELGYLARRDVHDFDPSATPRLCEAVLRLSAKPEPCTRQDVRRAIEAGIRVAAGGNDDVVTLGEWVFGIPAEAHRDKLTGRQVTVGGTIGRSMSSIRQTDQPKLIDKLVRFLLEQPAGLFCEPDRTPARLRDSESDYKVRRVALTVDLNPMNQQFSRATIEVEIEALQPVEFFRHSTTLAMFDGITVRSGDGRVKLLPVGHPMRPTRDKGGFRLDPPCSPGERYVVRLRHRNISTADFLGPLQRGEVVGPNVETIELRLRTPARWDYHPLWYESDGFSILDQGKLPQAHIGARVQEFACVISDPSPGRMYGIHLDPPSVERFGEYCHEYASRRSKRHSLTTA